MEALLADLVLPTHIAASGVGLAAMLPALFARKRRGLHTRAGRMFVVMALVAAATALLLVARRPTELIGLGVLGVLTLGWAGGGWWMAVRRPRVPGGWLVWHLNLVGSAAIAVVTAFAVQVADGHVLAWVLPTVFGSPLIARRSARERRRGRRTPADSGGAPGQADDMGPAPQEPQTTARATRFGDVGT